MNIKCFFTTVVLLITLMGSFALDAMFNQPTLGQKQSVVKLLVNPTKKKDYLLYQLKQ